MDNDYLTKKMIKIISDCYPYRQNDVRDVYERCKSFDKTIEIIERSLSLNISLSNNYHRGRELMIVEQILNNAQNQPSCLGAVMPSIYSMKLHDVIALTPTSIEGTAVSYFSIMRVAGGWIYQTWDKKKQDYIRETFVPFNNEFMSV